MSRVLHVCVPDKPVPPFIAFVEQNFDIREHSFLIGGRRSHHAKFPTPKNRTIRFDGWFHKLRNFWRLYRAEKILIHGLFDPQFIYLICLQPWLLKKCFWIIWGGDLHQFKKPPQTVKAKVKEFFRAFAIRRLGHILTHIQEDFELARQWYSTGATFHYCLCYESNTAHPKPAIRESRTLRIQIGNSAYSRNNHFDAIDRVAQFADSEIEVIAPLSYGPPEEANKVAAYGKARLGDKFVPILDFLPLNEYLELLESIDIALFNQTHQQAMGNIINLLGMGKTVYLHPDSCQWRWLTQLQIKIFSILEFNLRLITDRDRQSNITIIQNNFSKNRLIEDYTAIFNGLSNSTVPTSAKPSF